MNNELEKYLLSRGIKLDPTEIEEGFDPILSDKALVKEAAELWETRQNLITMIIQARVNAVARDLLFKALPVEVPVLRQALVEISALTDDFAKYVGEQKRIKASTEGEETPEEHPDTPDEGEEGSL